MRLTGAQGERLSITLRDAFTKDQLEQLLKYRLNRRLDDISLKPNMRAIVFDIIGDAERQGWLADLIGAALDVNPGNADVVTLAFDVGLIRSASAELVPERIIDEGDGFQDVKAYLSRLGDVIGAVCRIEIPSLGGTGFLVGPDLVMTNWHVVAALTGQDDFGKVVRKPVPPERAAIRFEYMREASTPAVAAGTAYGLAKDWLVAKSYMSEQDFGAPGAPPDDRLDCAIVRLAEPAALHARGTRKPADGSTGPARGSLVARGQSIQLRAGQGLTIIQHPESQPMKLAHGAVTSVLGSRLRYTANTERGSSGSPCFDANLELLAIHHLGDTADRPKFNEGVPLASILATPEFNQVIP